MSYYHELQRRITTASTFDECSELFKEAYGWMVEGSDNVKNHGGGFSFHFDIYDSLDRYAHRNAPWLRCLRKMESLASTLVELNVVYHATQPWLKEESTRRFFERKEILVKIRSTAALKIISSISKQLQRSNSATDITRIIWICHCAPELLRGFIPFFYNKLSTYDEVLKVVSVLYSHGAYYKSGTWYEVHDNIESPLLSSQHSRWILEALAAVRPASKVA